MRGCSGTGMGGNDISADSSSETPSDISPETPDYASLPFSPQPLKISSSDIATAANLFMCFSLPFFS